MTYNERAQAAKTEHIPEWMFGEWFEIVHNQGETVCYTVTILSRGWQSRRGYGRTISEAANAARKLRDESCSLSGNLDKL